jgi:hypothetical protein
MRQNFSRGIMSPERDRIARLGSGQRLLVFGFWRGQLPEVARLHFLTVAKALPPQSRYIVFTFEAVVPPAMQDLLNACGIETFPFDLPRLMAETGTAHLLRRTPFSGCWATLGRLSKRPFYRGLLARCGYVLDGRFFPRANWLLGGPPTNGVILSNYARVIIGSIVPEHTLYTDIDFAFPRPLDWVFRHESFVYRWERKSYANSALISVTDDSPIKRGALIDLLNREGAGRAPILFSQRNCDAVGLEVLPCDRLDPQWSKIGPNGPGYRRFFNGGDSAEQDLAFLREHFDGIHWHNKWKEVPEAGSRPMISG